MKKKFFSFHILMSIAVALTMAVFILVNTFAPIVILPQINIPNIAALSLIVLLIEHYAIPDARHCYIGIAVLSALTFGLMPLTAGYTAGTEAVKVAVVGSVVCTVTVWLFSSMADRVSSGPKAHGAIFVSAVALWLAFQCFTGIIL